MMDDLLWPGFPRPTLTPMDDQIDRSFCSLCESWGHDHHGECDEDGSLSRKIIDSSKA